MADQIGEIKQKIDIVELVGEYVQLKRAGRNFKGNCPFHGEKTPSFMVNPELSIYKCFGCGEAGDCFTFVQKMEGMNFGEVLRMLADKVGVKLISYKPTQGEELKDRLLTMNDQATRAYEYLLKEHKAGKKALEYLLGRGITKEAIEKFRIGYVPDGWRFLEDYLVKKKKYSIDDLRRAGLVVDDRGYDRFRGRIMFPLADARGRVVGFAGRVMPGADEKNGAKYINTPETEIYHKSELLYGFDVSRGEIKKNGMAIVVEGELDMICSWQSGIKNVVAIKGSALTEQHVDWLRRVCEKVILALDADLAGNMAARRGIILAEKKGMFVETVDWSLAGGGVKDVADIASTDSKKWHEMVENPISIYSFYIGSAVKKYGLAAEGKTKIAREVLPLLAMIDDEVRKDEYLKELARRVEIDVKVLRTEFEKANSTTGKMDSKKSVEEKSKRRDVLERYVVGLAIEGKKWKELEAVVELFGDGVWKKIVLELVDRGGLDNMPKELMGKIEELVFVDMEWTEKEWRRAVEELEEVGIREKIFEYKGKEEKRNELMKLMEKLSSLTKDR